MTGRAGSGTAPEHGVDPRGGPQPPGLGPQPPGGPGRSPSRSSLVRSGVIWAVLVAAFIGVFVVLERVGPRTASVTKEPYATFRSDVRAGRVSSVTLTGNGAITGTLTSGAAFSTQGPLVLPDQDLNLLDEHDVARSYTSASTGWGWIGSVGGLFLPILLLGALWLWIARRGSAGATRAAAFGRNPGHVYTTERPPTTFDDVAGYEAVKADIHEVVEFLRDPAKFQEIGARIPKGVLLVGPPGTGKTGTIRRPRQRSPQRSACGPPATRSCPVRSPRRRGGPRRPAGPPRHGRGACLARGQAADRPGAAGPGSRRGHDRGRRQRRAGPPRGEHRHRHGPVGHRRGPGGRRPGAARRPLRLHRRRHRAGTGDLHQRPPIPHLPPHGQRGRAHTVPGVGALRWSLPARTGRAPDPRPRHRDGHDVRGGPRRRAARTAPARGTAHLRAAAEPTVLRRAFGVLGPTEALWSMAAFVACFVAAGWRPGDPFPTGATLASASGAAFMAVVLAQAANAFACRSSTRWPGDLGWTTNRLLPPAIAIGLAFSLVVLLVPPIAHELGQANPPIVGWLMAFAAPGGLLAVDAIDKRRGRGRRRANRAPVTTDRVRRVTPWRVRDWAAGPAGAAQHGKETFGPCASERKRTAW